MKERWGKHLRKGFGRKNHGRKILPPFWRAKLRGPSVSSALPNIITLAALCVGLSALRFSFLGQWRQAVASVLIAALLDGLDGRLARFLNASSDFGAELDSLVDFINFGVAPVIIVYCHSLREWGHRGWSLCLFFSACMALRLARFNIQRTDGKIRSCIYSVGVPAPAGALLTLTPILGGFGWNFSAPVWVFGFFMGISGLLLVSRYPTFLLKKNPFPRAYWPLALVGLSALAGGLVSAPWETLFVIALAYIITLPISGYCKYRYGTGQ